MITARNLPVVSADPYLNECLVSYWEAALARRSSHQNSIRAAVENAILPLLPHGKARVGNPRVYCSGSATYAHPYLEPRDPVPAEEPMATLSAEIQRHIGVELRAL